MADKTRILVTNDLNVLPHCDRIVVLEGASASAEKAVPAAERGLVGRLVEQGSYSELMAGGQQFAQLVNKFAGEPGKGQHGHDVNANDGMLLTTLKFLSFNQ